MFQIMDKSVKVLRQIQTCVGAEMTPMKYDSCLVAKCIMTVREVDSLF